MTQECNVQKMQMKEEGDVDVNESRLPIESGSYEWNLTLEICCYYLFPLHLKFLTSP